MTQKQTTVRRAYKFRAYPVGRTSRKAKRAMRTCGAIWNAAVGERWGRYHESQKNDDVKPVRGSYEQYHLVRKREHPEYAHMDAQSMQDVLVKVDGSFKSYWALKKKDPDAKPPKIKKELWHYKVLVFRQSGWRLEGNRLVLSRIGEFKLKLHRPFAGRIKTVTVSRSYNKWYVVFSCDEVPTCALPDTGKSVKIFFADGCFLYDNNGRLVHHPQFYFSQISRLRVLSRALSRKQKGSKNRDKARTIFRRFHAAIKDRRSHFLWSLANDYVAKYDVIDIPSLPLKRMIQHAATGIYAMRLCDSAYALFVDMLRCKAEEYGRKITEYDSDKLFDIQKITGPCRAMSHKVVAIQ